MLRIGSVTLDKKPRIAAPFTDRTSQTIIDEAVRIGLLDIAEARIDLFTRIESDYVIAQLDRLKNTPTIATIRTQEEGGKWNQPEEERLRLFRAVLTRAGAVDIELNSLAIRDRVIEAAKAANRCVIISYHNFLTTPDNTFLEDRLQKAKEIGADIVKIATYIRSADDIRTLASLLLSHPLSNLLLLGMGDYGRITRILFPTLGLPMTFAYLDQPTASGQLSVRETNEYLQFFYPDFSAA